jgi:hypothetical protein
VPVSPVPDDLLSVPVPPVPHDLISLSYLLFQMICPACHELLFLLIWPVYQ